MSLNHLLAIGLVSFGILASQISIAQESDHQLVAILDIEKVMQVEGDANEELIEIRAQTKKLKAEFADSAPMKNELKELDRREAEILVKQFGDIQKNVATIAKTHGISLVLPFDSTPVKDDESLTTAHVSQRIKNNPVFHRRLDLTNIVINYRKKNRRSGGETAAISSAEIELPFGSSNSIGTLVPSKDSLPIRGTFIGELKIENN